MRLKPHAVHKTWGGPYLNAFAELGHKDPVGELVLFSLLPEFPVTTETGELLSQWVAKNPEFNSENFPFLLKLLSTRDPMSVQVHPSDNDLKKLNLKGLGKAESWVILDAADDARLFIGFKDGHNLADRIRKGTITLDDLVSFKPEPGEIYSLSPGTVHAANGEILVIEPQQASDYTFRIYDFDRDRPLHKEQAAEVIKHLQPVCSRIPEDLITTSYQIKFFRDVQNIDPEIKTAAIATWLGDKVEAIINGKKSIINWADSFLLKAGEKFHLELPDSEKCLMTLSFCHGRPIQS